MNDHDPPRAVGGDVTDPGTPPRCAVQWGVCPDHGNTLVDDGGSSRCTVCGRRWQGDRLRSPCAEPADLAITIDGVVDRDRRICRGHAVAAQGQTPPWVRFEPEERISRNLAAAPRRAG